MIRISKIFICVIAVLIYLPVARVAPVAADEAARCNTKEALLKDRADDLLPACDEAAEFLQKYCTSDEINSSELAEISRYSWLTPFYPPRSFFDPSLQGEISRYVRAESTRRKIERAIFKDPIAKSYLYYLWAAYSYIWLFENIDDVKIQEQLKLAVGGVQYAINQVSRLSPNPSSFDEADRLLKCLKRCAPTSEDIRPVARSKIFQKCLATQTVSDQ